MKRRSGSGDRNALKGGGKNTAKKAKPAGEAEAGGFWVETRGDPKVRAQLAREKENAKRQQEELEQRQRHDQELRRAEDALVRQVASFIPAVPGTELSTITVSAYRIIPLLPFAPPSPKVHTMLVRMRPNERLCFHGRVHVRVFEGCAQVFGHHFHASAEYHTLLSPFTSGALFIDAVAPTEAMIKMKEERDKLQSSHAQSSSSSSSTSLSSSSSPAADHVASAQLDPAYSVLDEDIRNVLAKKRAQEDPKGMQELETKAETVLVLRSFYEEPSKQKSPAQLSGMAPASLPISPSATTLRESAGRRYFVLDLKEAEARQPLKLRVAPPVAEEDSGESDSDSDSDDEAEGAASESKEDRDNERERGDTTSEAVVEGGADGASGDKAMEVVLDGQPTTATSTATTTATTTTMPTAAAPTDTMPAAATPANTMPTAAVPAENRGKDEAESEAVEGEQRAAGAQQAATSSTNPGLLPQETVDELVSHYLRIPGFYADSALQIPRAWAPLASSLMPLEAADGNAQRPMDVEAESAHPPAGASSTQPPRVVITGRKGMGKSTIAQYLLNSLLNRYSHVVYLDTDLGQPEFTPAGLVSLHVISSPVFGPSFMHLASPLKAYFMGDVSVDEVFETYSQAMRMLVDYYYTATLPGTDIPLSRLPLIVNTHGWLKGLGFEVLRNLIRYLAPDVAVHIYPITLEYADKGPDFPFVEEEVGYRFRAVHLLPAVVPKRSRMLLGPDDLRRLRLDAYFDCWNEGSLVTQIPYRVPWNAIRLALADADVPPSECLLAFNASLVGLCIDTADYLSCAPPGQADLSRGQSIYPSFLLSAPRCECVGLGTAALSGIVRTIDPVTHQFLVLTSVPPERLQRVNTFVKGAIHLPAPTLLRGGWLSNPYLMTEAISRPGGAKMTGRPNIQRKHTTSGAGRK